MERSQVNWKVDPDMDEREKHILIVDDSEGIQKMYALYLLRVAGMIFSRQPLTTRSSVFTNSRKSSAVL